MARTAFSPTGRQVATISDVPSVGDLSWWEGLDYITVTTDNMVTSPIFYMHIGIYPLHPHQVFLYPLETCSEATTCEECTGEGSFPLCGWCTVENKCSRRSQCESSSEERRWVVSSEQCIIISVTPQQFILETPTIVSEGRNSDHLK